ncbi:MAG: cache domain-containing protein [Nitrososphaeraceae archaeon]
MSEIRFLNIILLTAFFIMITLTFTHNSFGENSTSQIIIQNNNNLSLDDYDSFITYLISKNLETKIEKVSAILDIVSKIPEIGNKPYSSLLNKTISIYNGLPQDIEVEKRNILKNILEKYSDFSVISLLMPNGDVYLQEPFFLQENLTKTNFSFRDYYKGAIESKNIFMDDVIISASSGLPITVIAVPVYSDSNKLSGLVLGILNFENLNKFLQSINISTSQRILFLDHSGRIIADSLNNTSITGDISSFSNLQSFKNAILGGSGKLVESIGNTEVAIYYHPVKAIQNTWVVLSMKSHDEGINSNIN